MWSYWEWLGAFIDETQAPGNEDQSKDSTDDDHYLAELANQAFDTQGQAVPAAVAKVVQNHLNRGFVTKTGTKSPEDSSQPGMILSKALTLLASGPAGLMMVFLRPWLRKQRELMPKLHMVQIFDITSICSREIGCLKEKCSKDMHYSFNAVFGLLADSIEHSCFWRARTSKCVKTIRYHLSITILNI